MSTPDNEYESAAAEARQRGMAFMVDGKHVNADRVFIFSVPDSIGPISDMRRAKQEALAVMRDMDGNEYVGARLRRLCKKLGVIEPAGDDSELAKHAFSMLGLISTAVDRLLSDMADARADSGITNVRLAMDSKGALGHWIDGMLVTDPELAAPITEAAPGITAICGDCGEPFDGPGLFCPTCQP